MIIVTATQTSGLALKFASISMQEHVLESDGRDGEHCRQDNGDRRYIREFPQRHQAHCIPFYICQLNEGNLRTETIPLLQACSKFTGAEILFRDHVKWKQLIDRVSVLHDWNTPTLEECVNSTAARRIRMNDDLTYALSIPVYLLNA